MVLVEYVMCVCMLPLLLPFNFLLWTALSPSLPPHRWVCSTLFIHVVGYTYWNARPPQSLLLAAHAAAGKDVSFSAGVLSLSHSTRAHDELAWRIKHHRLGLRQFSWAVRNRVKWANGHVSISLSDYRKFVSHRRRVYFVTGLCFARVVDMVPNTCIKMDIRPNKIPFNLHYRYFTDGFVFLWCGLREFVEN